MAREWEESGRPSQESWEERARLLVRAYPDYALLAYVNPSYVVEWAAPPRDAESLRGRSHLLNQSHIEATMKAKELKAPVTTEPGALLTGGAGLTVMHPLYRAESFEGLLIGAFRPEPVMQRALQGYWSGAFSARLTYDGNPVAASGSGACAEEFRQETDFPLQGEGRWRLSLCPKPGVVRSQKGILPVVTLIGGLGLSLLIALLSYLAQTGFRRLGRVRKDEAGLRERNLALETRLLRRTEEALRKSEALERKSEELARTKAELERFAGLVAHDLKSPVASIVSFAELAEEEYGGPFGPPRGGVPDHDSFAQPARIAAH
ncbi:MAG: hypothetical protein HC902_05125 [Calothrix sp. SM1_5_4]|nr:hypothetical protein [Calothrix sp. SM1_5_4]